MTEDLGLEGDNYEWLLTAFYITYIVNSLYHSTSRDLANEW